jgi:hypothetical protein
MSKYLVECSCGNKLPVEMGQAGGRITCSCGNFVDVPTLRKLRHLPPAETEVVRPTSTWSARKGLITASLLVAGALTIVNAWSWFTQPKIPEFNAATYLSDVIEPRLKAMTPTGAWEWWINYYKPLAETGFRNLELSRRAEMEAIIAARQSLRRTLWIVAAIAAATAAVAAFWPRSQSPV